MMIKILNLSILTINRKDDIETSKIQLSGRITQLIPFIKKFDPER